MRPLNRASMTTATTGTGTVTLVAAVVPYQTWGNAGAVNGYGYRYIIKDGNDWEIGWGVYGSAGPTLTRNLIESSTGALLNLSGTATVSQGTTKQDDVAPWRAPSLTGLYANPDSCYFATGTIASAANSINLYPFSGKAKVDAIAVEVTTLLAANNVRGGLYSCHPVTGLPHLLIEEGAMQSVATTGIKAITFAAALDLLEPVWIATLFSGATTCRAVANSNSNLVPSAALNQANPSFRLTTPLAFGALSADLSAATFTSSAAGYPMAALRMA